MQTSKLTAKGQVTIPLQIRKKLGVRASSRIGFDISHDSEVTLIKVDTKKSLAGRLINKIKNITPVSIEDLN